MSQRWSQEEKVTFALLHKMHYGPAYIAESMGRSINTIRIYGYRKGRVSNYLTNGLTRFPYLRPLAMLNPKSATQAIRMAYNCSDLPKPSALDIREQVSQIPPNLPRNKRIKKMRSAGMLLVNIGKEFGISGERVRQIIIRKETNIPRKRHIPVLLDWNAGLPVSVIAQKHNYTINRIYLILKKYRGRKQRELIPIPEQLS